MADLGFWNIAQATPSHPAVIDPGGREVLAGELLRSANRAVHGLRALGLGPGDTIAVMMTNEVAMLELYMAAAQAGFYITPINTHLAPPEVAYILQDCDAKAFFCSASTADTSRRALEQLSLSSEVCFTTGQASAWRPYESLKAGQPDSLPADRRAGSAMTYTSGTTGRPKGVRRPFPLVSPDVLAENFAMFLALFGIQPHGAGVHLVVSPLYHTAVLNFCSSHLHFGHTVVLMDKWTPEAMLELIERHRVTATHLVPTQFKRLLSLSDEQKSRRDLSSLRHVIHSAAPCPVDVKRRMLDWWGPVIYEYYAASEGGGTLATPQEWLEHPGTVGKPWPISKLRIVRDDGTECAPAEIGTVYIHMGQHRFEYHKDKQKTESSWRDDYFTVGDAGYLNDQGFLFLCDRKADMIISGGVNIYPAEIEAVIGAHPKVADVAVFGIPDDDWGERVMAVVEPVQGDSGGPELAGDILAFCAERLAKFKQPRSIEFVAELPRDPNGKLYKRKLRDPYWVGRKKP